MSREKTEFIDDGRTVVDMSLVDRRTPFGWRRENETPAPETRAPEPRPARPWEDRSISRSERRAFIRGTVGASLLIGSVYFAAFALLIGIILLIAK